MNIIIKMPFLILVILISIIKMIYNFIITFKILIKSIILILNLNQIIVLLNITLNFLMIVITSILHHKLQTSL